MPPQAQPALSRTLDDERRLRAARRVLASGTRSEQLDRLTRLAAELLGAPQAQVSLLTDQQFALSLADRELAPEQRRSGTPARDSLCTVTVESAAPLVVPDAAADVRVRGLPPVARGEVGAYLGVPLVGAGAVVLGALCVYDTVARAWPATAVLVLEQLAQSVVAELELRALTVQAGQDAARLELALQAADIGSFDLDVATGELVWDERLIRAVRLRRRRVPGDARGVQRPRPPRGPGAGQRGHRARGRGRRRLLHRVPHRASRRAHPLGRGPRPGHRRSRAATGCSASPTTAPSCARPATGCRGCSRR